MKKLLFVIGLSIGINVVAEDFPTAGGDLVDAQGWSSVNIVNGGTYTASQDVSFGPLHVNTASPVVFDLRGETVRNILTASFSQTVIGANTTIKGGNWNFSNTDFYVGKDEATTTTRTLAVTEGAELSGIKKMYVASREGGNVLAITNATVNAEIFYGASGRMDAVNKLLVGENGLLNTIQFFSEAGVTSNSKQAPEIRFEGKNATLKSSKYVYLAHMLPNTRFVATDGAVLDITAAYIGCSNTYKRATGSRILVDDNSTLKVSNYLSLAWVKEMNDIGLIVSNSTITGGSYYIGNGEGAYDNFMDIVGSTANVSMLAVNSFECAYDNTIRIIDSTVSTSSLKVGAAANTTNAVVIITNSVVEAKDIPIGTQDSVSNKLIIAGKGTTFVSTSTGKAAYPMNGKDSLLHITDGAVFTNANTRQLLTSASGSTIRIDNGARWEIGNPTHIGYETVWDVADPTNKMIVANGGTISSIGTIYVRATSAELIVDGGNIKSSAMTIGYITGSIIPQNCALVVKGDANIQVAGLAFVANTRSRLMFAPNDADWQEAPIQSSKAATLASDTQLSADLSGYMSTHRGNADLTLITAAAGLTVPQAVLDAANAKFTGRYSSCYFYVEGKALKLAVRRKGLTVLIK